MSDTSLRFITLAHESHRCVPIAWGEVPIPEGLIKDGLIIDLTACTAFLRSVRLQHKLKTVHIALDPRIVATALIPLKKDVPNIDAALRAVLAKEEITSKDHIIEYTTVATTGDTIVVEAHIIPERIARDYLRVYMLAGYMPAGFAVSGQAHARALVGSRHTDAVMLVHIGTAMTTLSIVVAGIAVQTSTVPFGGASLVATLAKELDTTPVIAHDKLISEGVASAQSETFDILTDKITLLKDEIRRAYVHWHEKKDSYGVEHPVDRIELCGEYASIEGLADYLSASLRAQIIVGNPWAQCLSFEDVIPQIVHHDAQRYVTAIGLALGTNTHLNLLPMVQKQLLKRRRTLHRTLAIIVTSLLAIGLAAGIVTLYRYLV